MAIYRKKKFTSPKKVGGPEIGAAHKSQKVGGPWPARPNRLRRQCEQAIPDRGMSSSETASWRQTGLENKSYRSGGGETICPSPADGSSIRGGSTSVRGRVRSPHMAKLQAASVPIALGSCAMGQTDGRIAVSLNSPYSGGIQF